MEQKDFFASLEALEQSSLRFVIGGSVALASMGLVSRSLWDVQIAPILDSDTQVSKHSKSDTPKSSPNSDTQASHSPKTVHLDAFLSLISKIRKISPGVERSIDWSLGARLNEHLWWADALLPLNLPSLKKAESLAPLKTNSSRDYRLFLPDPSLFVALSIDCLTEIAYTECLDYLGYAVKNNLRLREVELTTLLQKQLSARSTGKSHAERLRGLLQFFEA